MKSYKKKSGYCMADFWNICLYIFIVLLYVGLIAGLVLLIFLCKYSKAIKTKTDEELSKS